MRPIDADVLGYEVLEEYGADGRSDDVNVIYGMIINAPTVDAVEIVRCRDCKWWWKEWETCTHENLVDGNTCATTFKADDFCSYGEKK